ncbi:MAG: 30S ribosomal protein S6 modification protein RimK [Sulfurovum sp. AS07-7]|nr:MAG: 30S ribosomal protein S6 modification protein RimK [Sulfurovum sp. AS07-7]
MAGKKESKLPKIGFLYMDYVLRFFDKSNFQGWPDKIESVVYHWKNDKERFIKEVKRKKIEVLIGNVPATAYETFREIARELPEVRFIPSLDTQFSNKSKENVTRFAWKYNLAIPKTYIYYNRAKGYDFLEETAYPKIVKRSYGPSNYGGYFVHKVDSVDEAKELFDTKKYHPMYLQDFVPMEADVRVMLIGHKPVCAFWRRAPEGEWLTNTSQGGSMDYMNVPASVLDLAVKTSKAAKAEYWACDIAYSRDGSVRILECATAFAAFPYIRDWIGQYLMSILSHGKFKKPHLPMFNWEELGKVDSKILRTMRNITFGREKLGSDGEMFLGDKRAYGDGEYYLHELDSIYKMFSVKARTSEEWASEEWNFQSKYPLSSESVIEADIKITSDDKVEMIEMIGSDESSESVESNDVVNVDNNSVAEVTEVEESQKKTSQEVESKESSVELIISYKELKKLLLDIEGIGKKKLENIFGTYTHSEVVEILETKPSKLSDIKGINKEVVKDIKKAWKKFKKSKD